jgi:hypothetical protein
MTPTGTMAIINAGVFTEITTRVVDSVESMIENNQNARGTRSSKMSISLEKRFIILPTGVVSKNDIGERKMRNSMEECMDPEALMSLVSPMYANRNRKIPAK